MRRIIMFSLTMLLAVTSVASTTNGNTQDGKQEDRPRRAWVGGAGGSLFERGSYMGITLGEMDAEAARRLGVKEERGALVSDVIADGPGARAGLKKDDIIVRWNGQPVDSASQLARHRRETPAGRTVRLGLVRDGREMEVDLKLGEREDITTRVWDGPAIGRGDREMFFSLYDRGRLGASLQSLTPQLADYFGLSGRRGVLVSSVSENSAAAKAGLQAGDIILSIGGEDIDNPMEVGRELRKRDEGPVEIKVFRNKQERSLTIQLEKRQGALLPDFSGDVDELIALPMDFSFDMPNIHIPEIQIPHIEMQEFNLPDIDLSGLKFFGDGPNVLSLPKIVIPKNLKRERVHL